jgi:Protein of unknown function (DUF4079)
MTPDISALQTTLTDALEPIAAQFRALLLPEVVTRWGHPLMMGIVVFVMGSFVALAGWRGRVLSDPEASQKNRLDHRKLAPWLFLFIAAGYSGGILSLLIQGQPIIESPHFWTGTAVIVLLASNGLISATRFGGNQAVLRTTHAYLGTVAMGLLFVHAALGLTLGLAL